MNKFAIGLDIGSNSIGWAMINLNPSLDIQNIIAGVRVLPEGTEKTSSGEQSRNKKRRDARLARRQHDRRGQRKETLRMVLRKVGLFPLDYNAEIELMRKNPYELRRKGIDEEVSEEEFSRILINLNSRRGFKSNLKESKEKKKEKNTGNILNQISDLEKKIMESGSRTLGEYLAHLLDTGEKIRGKYTRRNMYEDEFELLWNKQSQFKPDMWNDKLKEKIKHIIFYQRPLKSQAEQIGKCPLEPDERRCSRSSWFAHQFRIIQEINNIRILQYGKRERRLNDGEKNNLLECLMKQKTLTMNKIREKILKLEKDDILNFEKAERKSLEGNEVEYGLRNIFGENFENRPDFYRDEVFEKLIEEDPEVFKQIAREQYSLSDEQIEALYVKIDQRPGYLNLSKKAIKKLLPFLEKGMELHEAQKAAGYKETESPVIDYLPQLNAEDIRNPVVVRALSETRKVVNAIIREYGKPEIIRIELARETKGTIKSRAERNKKLREIERYHKDIAEILKEHDIQVNRENIEKYKLWEECG
ncbi:type II CRISPR RNA-guided endonuclease Cas9, partial [Candidatus Sumerlaeota bacterium]|nr:type II CRISPR RNA-guided endonuclease Cas9 [Candidatus Sumerlaeota bacterium]